MAFHRQRTEGTRTTRHPACSACSYIRAVFILLYCIIKTRCLVKKKKKGKNSKNEWRKKAFPAVAVTFIYVLSNDFVDRNLLCSRRSTIIVITLCATAERDDRHKSGTAQKDRHRRGDCDRIDPRPTAARGHKTQCVPNIYVIIIVFFLSFLTESPF